MVNADYDAARVDKILDSITLKPWQRTLVHIMLSQDGPVTFQAGRGRATMGRPVLAVAADLTAAFAAADYCDSGMQAVVLSSPKPPTKKSKRKGKKR